MKEKLEKFRKCLDLVDDQISTLLNERMEIVDKIAELKKTYQLAIKDPSREEAILRHVEMLTKHPAHKETMANIYKAILEQSKLSQKFFNCLQFPFRKVGIIGKGLIGGSILRAIQIKDPEVEIVTCDKGDEIPSEVDLLILASPISTITPYAERVLGNKGLVVMDVASVKREIVDVFERLSDDRKEFVGTHPLAGSEKCGFENARAQLFVNRPWVITKHQKNSAQGLRKIEQVIQFLGAHPVYLDANEHDLKVALISHLPGELARAYEQFVRSVDEKSVAIAGPGFTSFTRLAHTEGDLLEEIRGSNQGTIEALLQQWMQFLGERK